MTLSFERPRTLVIVLLAVSAVSCTGGGSAPAPTATGPSTARSPTAAATATPAGPAEPQADRILEHIRVLSDEIGIRPGGSDAEQRAIEYARGQFERAGYRVEVQPFTTSVADAGPLRPAALAIERPERRTIRAVAFAGAAAGEARGRLVDAGTGRAEEVPPEADGAVVLIQRQDVLFSQMARRARDAGAAGVVVANREPGLFPGELSEGSPLPMIAIDQSEGEELRALLGRGEVQATVSIGEEMRASNVIARPPDGAPCRTISGGHFDSVPWAPGANDNASGSALVLELARTAAAAGLRDHCFALFGAEEVGLKGSEHLASQLAPEERQALVAVFNYDVVAGDARPLAAGREELVDRAEAVASAAGIRLDRSNRPDEVPSDHLSFLRADLPAIVITTPDFETIHTPRDRFDNLDASELEGVAKLAFALLREFGEAAQAGRPLVRGPAVR